MQPPRVERKLTVILSADVAGYSRLMGEDEEGTLHTLKCCRDIIDRLIVEHRGRVFGTAGDSMVAEFSSAVEAIRCAIEVQTKVEERNANLASNRCMRFRIGINLGDVMVEGDNLYGDGVNVATRLQELAEPGGICFSGSVYEQVRRKLVRDYEDLGDRAVKNITDPIRVYRIPGTPLEASETEQRAATSPGDAERRPRAARLLSDGHAAMARHAWQEAFASFREADGLERLSPGDLESLAEAAFWNGQMEDCVSAQERAYALYLELGNQRRAAALSMALAEHAFHRLAHSVARGWVKRAEHLLTDQPESIEHGYLARFQGRLAFDGEGDTDRGLSLAERAFELGTRFRDRDLEMLALHDRGEILVAKGRVSDGMALMEEAMVAAVGGELGAIVTGRIYCNMIDICEKLADYRRAAEWDQAARRWCERVGHASGFPGICRVKRAEIMRLCGTWVDAEHEAQRACVELKDFLIFAARAFHEIGEIRLLLGDLAGAEQAFGRAQELGCDPQPGLARLRLAQGSVTTARTLMDRALGEHALTPLDQARLLPARIEIAVAEANLDIARSAAEELRAIAEAYGSIALKAEAACAEGSVQLAEHRTPEAVASLRRACRLWRDSAIPYEEARSRLLLGLAYREQGNGELADLELETARGAFERLGAVRDCDRAMVLLQRHA